MIGATPSNDVAIDTGVEKLSIPNLLWKLNPVAPSKLMNDDPKMEAAMVEANKSHATYQILMAVHTKTVSQLEITLRQKHLRSKFYGFVAMLALVGR